MENVGLGSLIEAATTLRPRIVATRDQVEKDRRLPDQLVKELQDAGMFDLWLPRSFGGPELAPTEFARVIEVLAQADGSVAWCAGIAAALTRFSGFLDEAVARRIFIKDRAIVAGALAPTGRAVAVSDGYRVTGRWSFVSGIMHSSWTVGGAFVFEGDAVRRLPDGSPDYRVLFFPTTSTEIIDTWDVGGLRGTGSHDYKVIDLFVPTAHSIAGITQIPILPGPLYALSMHTIYPAPIAAVPLGIARAALDVFHDLAATKTPSIGTTLLRDKPTVQACVGRAEATLRAARAFLFEVYDEIWAVALGGSVPTLQQRALARLACAQVASAAKEVVQMIYDAASGSSVYERCPLQRLFRDVHTATQHFQVHSANFESGGRVMLGLDPGTLHL
jgi:indole-3-acetate monooxygenase